MDNIKKEFENVVVKEQRKNAFLAFLLNFTFRISRHTTYEIRYTKYDLPRPHERQCLMEGLF